MSLKQAFAPLVDLAYPPRCPLCGAAIAEQRGLCGTCWSQLVIPGEPACSTCQRPLGRQSGEAVQCGACLADPPWHGGITAATLYNDTARDLVLALKHGGKIALAPMLAHQVLARLPVLEGEWLVVPVPLHRWRLWRRGFNQSALLAREIARTLEQPLVVDALLRRKATPSLGGLGRKARSRALSGAIVTNPARVAQLRGASVLLVDDVMTSGATTDACIGALRKARVKKVRIACFSRVLDDAI